MNMFARFDEIPAMTLQDIKETKRNRRTHTRTFKVKTVYPPQTKFAGGGGYKNTDPSEIKGLSVLLAVNKGATVSPHVHRNIHAIEFFSLLASFF